MVAALHGLRLRPHCLGTCLIASTVASVGSARAAGAVGNRKPTPLSTMRKDLKWLVLVGDGLTREPAIVDLTGA